MKTFLTVLVFIGLKIAELVGITFIYLIAKWFGIFLSVIVFGEQLHMDWDMQWIWYPFCGVASTFAFAFLVTSISDALTRFVKWNWKKAENIVNKTKTHHV